jgi:hypothetical protein
MLLLCSYSGLSDGQVAELVRSDASISRAVRLLQDIPELGLLCGEVGVVCSTWCEPMTAYEVEFAPPPNGFATRTLLMANQIQATEEAITN